MLEQQKFWLVARTRKDQEITVRNLLKKDEIGYFLPTQIIDRQLNYRKKEVEVPVIRNLIFIQATKEKTYSIINDYRVTFFYERFQHSQSPCRSRITNGKFCTR